MAESSSMVFLLLICLLASVQPRSAANTCTAAINSLNNDEFPLVKDARKCLQSIPYEKSVAAKVIDSVQKTFQFWPFLDIAKKAPDSRLSSKVDVFAELQKLKSKTFPNAQSFHKAIYDLINSLNDYNSIYFPHCFAEVASALPVDFYTFVENGTRVFKIAPFYGSYGVAKYASTKAVNLTKFWDATVHKVNGVAAGAHFFNFAKKSAFDNFKDLGVRFNSLFVSQVKNTKEYESGKFSNQLFLTDEDSVTLEVTRKGFSSKEVVTFPYFARFPPEFTYFDNATDYYKYCQTGFLSSSKETATTKNDPEKNFPAERFNGRNSFPSGNRFPPRRSRAVTASTDSLSSVSAVSGPTKLFDGYVQSWLLPDKSTGVLLISDFSPEFWDFNDTLKAFVSDVNASCQALLRRNVTHLIIDLQNNVRGYGEFSDLVIRYLFPSLNNIAFNYQLRAPLVSQKLVKYYNGISENTGSVFHYQTWANATNVPFKSPNGFFFPLVSKTLGGTKGYYSSLVSLQNYDIIKPPKNKAPKFLAKNILLLTNGLCAFGCAAFTSKMEEYAKVRSVSVGGFSGVPMSYSGGSGRSYSLGELVAFDLLGKFDNEPPRLPIGGDVGFSVAQSFIPSNSSVPLDYIFKPSTFRLPFSRKTALDNGALWTEVAKFF